MHIIICTASVKIKNNEVRGIREIGQNETFRYNFVFRRQVEVKVCISKGQVEIYISTGIPNPNSAYYDWHLELESSQDSNDSKICDSVIIDPENSTHFTSRSLRLRQLPPPSPDHEYGETVYFTVIGRAPRNVFEVLNSDVDVGNNDQNKSNGSIHHPHIFNNKTDEGIMYTH